jgi:N-acetylglutamate synthase-like GNAT family acetyltransferase
MGLFICFKDPSSRYKLPQHTKIETELVNKFGFQQITQADCNKIVQLILKVHNDKSETFCKYVDENGNSLGISTATVAGHTSGDETVLILSTKDNFEEIESGNDIRAILAFSYDNDEYKDLDINVLCSNQVTKSGGGSILVKSLIDVCKQEGIRKISLFAAESAVNFYKKMGFVNESDVHHNMMSLQLGGKYRHHLVLKLKRRKLKTKKLKTKKLKTKKLKTKKLKTK